MSSHAKCLWIICVWSGNHSLWDLSPCFWVHLVYVIMGFCFQCWPNAFRGLLSLPHIVVWQQVPSRFSASLRSSWSRLPYTKRCCAPWERSWQHEVCLHEGGESPPIKWHVNFPCMNLYILFPCANLCTWQKETACHHKHLASRFSNWPGSLGSISVPLNCSSRPLVSDKGYLSSSALFSFSWVNTHFHLPSWADCYQYALNVNLWYRIFYQVEIRAICRWIWVLSSSFNWWENSSEKQILKSSKADR